MAPYRFWVWGKGLCAQGLEAWLIKLVLWNSSWAKKHMCINIKKKCNIEVQVWILPWRLRHLDQQGRPGSKGHSWHQDQLQRAAVVQQFNQQTRRTENSVLLYISIWRMTKDCLPWTKENLECLKNSRGRILEMPPEKKNFLLLNPYFKTPTSKWEKRHYCIPCAGLILEWIDHVRIQKDKGFKVLR